ncbi:hypothetical protein LDENG_00141280 [Lucifuga dentata]|nr:hypothetical protein LDENG_00141280 [Lucifuga dentata]
MSDLCSESSEEEERPEERRMTRLPIIQLKHRPKPGSPGGSPRISPKDSPRVSPRNSPLLFRKLLMNRSISLQRRRFTLAHTPRYRPKTHSVKHREIRRYSIYQRQKYRSFYTAS